MLFPKISGGLIHRNSRRAAGRRGAGRTGTAGAWERLEDRALLAAFLVSSTVDAVDANPGDGVAVDALGRRTLRAAVMEANALGGSHTIQLGVGTFSLTIAGRGEDNAATGDLDFRSDITIIGAASAPSIINGNLIDRVFDGHGPGRLTLRLLEVTGGQALGTGTNFNEDRGGAIRTAFSVPITIENCVIRNNSAPRTGSGSFGSGGAIDSKGVLTITGSRFEGNAASNSGGAIYIGASTASTTVRNTTFANNAAPGGGAIFNHRPLLVENCTFVGNGGATVNGSNGGAINNNGGGELTLINSTLTANTSIFGGAISAASVAASTVIRNSTIAGNTSTGWGGGISGDVTLENSIVALNSAQNDGPDIDGVVTSLGFNLIGNTAGASGFVASDLLNVDPRLAALASNGGPTQTRALLAGSPAINAANTATAPATDQRGIARPQGAAADIGAFELVGSNFAPSAVADTYSVAEDSTLTTSAPSVLDQSNTTLNYQHNVGTSSITRQQQVTAGVAGVLQSVDLYIGEFSDPGTSFTFFVNRGAPWQTDAHQFSTLVTITQAMIDGWITIDVSSAGLSFAAGEVFIIGASSNGGGDAFLLGSNGDRYAGGAHWSNGTILFDGTYDLAFRTRVSSGNVGPAGVLANDADPDGNALTAVLVGGPANGTLTLNPDGSFVYTPNGNFFGSDSFTYRASDGSAQSDLTTVTINVTGVDDPLVAEDVSATIEEDTAFQGFPIVSNPDGGTLTYARVTTPQNGFAGVNATTGRIVYIPNANFFGTDSFIYSVSDGSTTVTATVSITINPVNDAPFTGPQGFTTPEDVALGSQLLAIEVENEPMTFALEAGPSHGQVTVNANGTFTYTPDPDFSGRYLYDENFGNPIYGSDSFTFRATDDKGNFRIGTAIIDVTPVDDAPVATGDALVVAEDTTLTISATPVSRLVMRSEPTDFVGRGLSYDLSGAGFTFDGREAGNDGARVIVNGPGHNWDLNFVAADGAPLALGAYLNAMRFPFQDPGRPGLSVSGNGRGENRLVGEFVVYDLVFNADRTDILAFAARFEQRGDDFGTIDPSALLGTIQYNSTFGTNAGVLANDTDGDGDFLATILVSGPTNGALTLNRDGTLSYTPNADFHGTDSFTYRVSDGVLTSEIATVTITVTPVNDAPRFSSPTYAFAIPEHRPFAAPVGTVSATDGDGVRYSIESGNGLGAFAIDAVTGQITVADSSKIDFETTPSFSLVVRATEQTPAGLFADSTVTINLTDVAAPSVTLVRFGYGNDKWVTAAELAGRAAPWQIKRIEITFDADVEVNGDDLIVSGVIGRDYFYSAFDYDSVTHIAVWTLSSAAQQDRLTLNLDGDGGSSDVNVGVNTGGEFLAGGDLSLNLDVLFGDVNGDGTVNITDMLLLRGANTTSDRWADLNGDGIVNITDMLLLRGRNGATLP